MSAEAQRNNLFHPEEFYDTAFEMLTDVAKQEGLDGKASHILLYANEIVTRNPVRINQVIRKLAELSVTPGSDEPWEVVHETISHLPYIAAIRAGRLFARPVSLSIIEMEAMGLDVEVNLGTAAIVDLAMSIAERSEQSVNTDAHARDILTQYAKAFGSPLS